MLCEPNQNAVRVLHRYAFPSVEICTDRVFHLWGPQHTVPLAIISMKKTQVIASTSPHQGPCNLDTVQLNPVVLKLSFKLEYVGFE